MIGDSVGEIDPVNMWYRWAFASGTAATALNKELVYDIKRNKWFEVVRGTDNQLQFILLVHDTYGNSYNYGFLDTGYMLRLENGTDFDGEDIVHEFHLGDLPLVDLATETQVDSIRLLTVAKATTANEVTLTHYADGATAGTDMTLSPARTGYRLAQPSTQQRISGDPFHSFKCVMTTDDETIGFEPLALVVGFHPTHKD